MQQKDFARLIMCTDKNTMLPNKMSDKIEMLLDFPATHSMHFPNQCMEILSIKKTLLMKGNLRGGTEAGAAFPALENCKGWRDTKNLIFVYIQKKH